MSSIDKMRKKQAELHQRTQAEQGVTDTPALQGVAVPPKPLQASPRPAPKPESPPTAPEALVPPPDAGKGQPPRQVIVRKCGHSEPLDDIKSRDCTACKVKRKKPGGTLKRHPADTVRHQRLPHGARFEVEYDAEAVMWRGILVLTLHPERKTFRGESSSLFALEVLLDRQWRDFQAAQREGK